MNRQFVVAAVAGQTYLIPEAWIVGATKYLTLQQAIRRWHEQAQMEEEQRRQMAQSRMERRWLCAR